MLGKDMIVSLVIKGRLPKSLRLTVLVFVLLVRNRYLGLFLGIILVARLQSCL